jgi:hypothetical protein
MRASPNMDITKTQERSVDLALAFITARHGKRCLPWNDAITDMMAASGLWMPLSPIV